MFQKILIAAILFVNFVFEGKSQTVKAAESTIQIKGEQAEGYEVQLDGTVNEIESQLLKFLKPVGKSKRVDDMYSISLSLINNKNYTSPIYVAVRDKGAAAAWIGVKPSEWSSNKDEVKKELQQLVHDFGVSFYRTKVQEQIDESTRALQAVERQQQKLVNQNKDLNTRLEDNKREKFSLRNRLKTMALNFSP
jgi:hypothetical protein